MENSAAEEPGMVSPVINIREQQRMLTRQRLVDSAIAAFNRDGYVNARIEDIAAAAGASRATFYLHFKSKLDVVRAVLTGLRTEFEEFYRQLDELHEPSWSDLRKWIANTVDYWERNRAALQIVNQAGAVEPDLTHDFVTRINTSAADITQHLDRWSPPGRDTAKLRASMFIMQLERFCYFWKVCGEQFDDESAIDALTDSLWLALHPPVRPAGASRSDKAKRSGKSRR